MANFEDIREISWNEASPLIQKVNPDLHAAMDGLNPTQDYKLYHTSYSFGARIMENGVAQLPLSKNRLVPISDSRVPAEIRDQLGYNLVPMGLIISKKIEVYKIVDVIEERVIPIALLHPGLILGLLEVMESPVSFCARHVWDAVAGGRSLYMLPKTTNSEKFQKLRRELGLKATIPRRYIDHWQVFTEIANQVAPNDDWQLEIIFLGKKWTEHKLKENSWLGFVYQLQKRLITGSSYFRNQLTFNIMWQSFAKILAKRRYRPDTYLFDTLKHVVAMFSGVIPGFRPINMDEDLGPIENFKDIFINGYGIEYAPTIMGPYHFNYATDNKPIYYSLQIPTLLESMPKFVVSESLLADLIKLRDLVKMFLDAADNNLLNIDGTIVEEALSITSFEFYHAKEEAINHIRPTNIMPNEDDSLTKFRGKASDLPFAENSKFLQGCIKIFANKEK
ncbi:MAG: hypothetical protein KAT71_07275 [Gammaproteobacteria bacterium]|nr:hypothetical protein [Gammaproteobacteria bacterium]